MDQFLAKRGPGGGGGMRKPGINHESKFISNVGIKNLKNDPETKNKLDEKLNGKHNKKLRNQFKLNSKFK